MKALKDFFPEPMRRMEGGAWEAPALEMAGVVMGGRGKGEVQGQPPRRGH